jgi:putative salt-induced outer membrane protein YdiY
MRFLWILLVAGCVLADEVKMKNGDRLTGSVVRLDPKELILKTEYAGEIKIVREQVAAIETSEAVNILLKDGQSIIGKLRSVDDRFEMSTETAGMVAAKQADVILFRSKADQDNYLRDLDRLRNPRLIDLWAGFVDVGYAQARGNASTSTISSSAKATRTTTRDAINTYFFSLYSSNTTAGRNTLTANSIRGGIKYDLNFTPKYYAFFSTDLEFDEFQGLDLRFVPAGGLGWHFIKNRSTVWDIFGGASMNREFFTTGLRRTSGELLAGNELTHKFSEMFTFSEKIVLFNNVSETGNYRVNGDVAFAAALRKWLSWQVSASNRYLSNPLPGRKTNDILVTTGIRFTFAK